MTHTEVINLIRSGEPEANINKPGEQQLLFSHREKIASYVENLKREKDLAQEQASVNAQEIITLNEQIKEQQVTIGQSRRLIEQFQNSRTQLDALVLQINTIYEDGINKIKDTERQIELLRSSKSAREEQQKKIEEEKKKFADKMQELNIQLEELKEVNI